MDRFIITIKKSNREKKYSLYFQYNKSFIETLKSIEDESREYDSTNKCWRFGARGLILLINKFKGLNTVFFDFGTDELRSKFLEDVKKAKELEIEEKRLFLENEENKKHWVKFKTYLENNYNEFSEKIHKNLKPEIKLFPHQIIGAMFCNEVRNTLIAHDMGLGKSILSISYSELNEFNKVVVITPNSLKFNYYNEVCKFTNSKAYVYNGKHNKYTPEESKYVIFNYEMLNPSDVKKVIKKINDLKIKDIDCLILDECQKLKTSDSNTYINFVKIFNKKIFKNGKESKIFMSGTPAPNRAYELYNVLHQISPIDFPTKNSFYNDYCGMKYNPDVYGGWDYDINKTNFEILFEKMKPFVDRRRKKDVLDLPEKTYQKIVLELDIKEQTRYNEIEEGVINELLDDVKFKSPLTILIKLRQYLSALKINKIKEIIDSILESGEKVVIVDMFKESLSELKNIYGDIAGLHTGDQSPDERNDIVVDFQNPNGKYKIFLGTVQTCNYGLTLTEANKMIILTAPYSVGEYDQVADRIYRIGQKNCVLIMCLLFLNTIDELVYGTLDEKRKELSSVIDNEKYESNYNVSLLSEIVGKLIKNNY